MGSLIAARNRILTQSPHLETASGQIATFDTSIAAPLKSLRVDFAPVQTGSGDPSPTNVRPISGRSGIDVHLSRTTGGGTVASVTWSPIVGTVYGGYVDLISGELVATHKIVTFDGTSDFTIQSSSLYVIWYDIDNMPSGDLFTDPYIMCDKCLKVPVRGNYEGNLKIRFVNKAIYLYYLNRYAGTTGSSNTVAAWLDANPITVTYPLAAPTHYQLSPMQIKSLRGVNNIWSDAGDVTVKYWTH